MSQWTVGGVKNDLLCEDLLPLGQFPKPEELARVVAELQQISALQAEVERLTAERAKLWDQRDAAYATWQPLTQWDNLRKERDAANSSLEISRNQTKDAFERVAKTHNECDTLKRENAEFWKHYAAIRRFIGKKHSALYREYDEAIEALDAARKEQG